MHRARVSVGAAVVLLHALAVSSITSRGTTTHPRSSDPIVEIFESTVIFQPPARDTVAIPEVRLSAIELNPTALRMVQFEDPDDAALGEIVAPSSAPRLRRTQTVDMSAFARRAGLIAGQAKTVILIAEIGEDGEPNQVDIVRSSGNAGVDAAAMDYALALRWIPATLDRRPRSMRISFPITLAVAE